MILTETDECVEMLKILLEQMRSSPTENDTIVTEVSPNSFEFVIKKAIDLLERP